MMNTLRHTWGGVKDSVAWGWDEIKWEARVKTRRFWRYTVLRRPRPAPITPNEVDLLIRAQYAEHLRQELNSTPVIMDIIQNGASVYEDKGWLVLKAPEGETITVDLSKGVE